MCFCLFVDNLKGEIMDSEYAVVADDSLMTKEDFLSHLSHEIRSPMQVINLQAMVAKTNLGEGNFQRAIKSVDQIIFASERLMYIVNDILNLSKMEAGKLEYKMEVLDIVKCVEGVLEEIQPLTIKKGINFETNFLITSTNNLCFDFCRISQVVRNIVVNSIKFGRENSLINIKIYEDEKNIFVGVANYGDEIPEEDMVMIFDKFFRSKNSDKLAVEGTGLGLTICKQIIKAHNGDICVCCKNNITTFTFSLPKQ